MRHVAILLGFAFCVASAHASPDRRCTGALPHVEATLMSTQLDPDARCRTAKQMAHADLPSLQEGDESYRLVSAQSRSQDGIHTLLRDEEGWTLHVRYFARL